MSDPGQGSFEVAYDPGRDLLRLEYIGRMTEALILAAADAVFAVPGITRRTGILAVYLHADIDGIDLAAVTAYHDHKAAKGYPDLPAAAVLADRPSHKAMGELWVATKPGGKASGAVFTNESDALAWLAGRPAESR